MIRITTENINGFTDEQIDSMNPLQNGMGVMKESGRNGCQAVAFTPGVDMSEIISFCEEHGFTLQT